MIINRTEKTLLNNNKQCELVSHLKYVSHWYLASFSIVVLDAQDGEALPADIHAEGWGCIMISLGIQGESMNFSSVTWKKREKIIKTEEV